MMSSTLPSLRVNAQLRDAAEGVLEEGETLSSFIERSVRESVERRRTRAGFVARGLLARDDAKRTGVYYPAEEVHARLAAKLAAAKKRLAR